MQTVTYPSDGAMLNREVRWRKPRALPRSRSRASDSAEGFCSSAHRSGIAQGITVIPWPSGEYKSVSRLSPDKLLEFSKVFRSVEFEDIAGAECLVIDSSQRDSELSPIISCLGCCRDEVCVIGRGERNGSETRQLRENVSKMVLGGLIILLAKAGCPAGLPMRAGPTNPICECAPLPREG